jgi:hypothetical protein
MGNDKPILFSFVYFVSVYAVYAPALFWSSVFFQSSWFIAFSLRSRSPRLDGVCDFAVKLNLRSV